MTMTPERLAELDAVMAKATKGMWAWDAGMIPPDGPGRYADIYVLDDDREPIILAEFNDNIPQGRDNARAIVTLHNAYPNLRAHIDAQAATIAGLVLAAQFSIDSCSNDECEQCKMTRAALASAS